MNSYGESPLLEKAKSFAIRIVKLYRFLKKSGESVMSKQLLRAGTSIGANIAEAQYAQSRADFTTKLSIALKEASETRYWIELLIDTNELADTDNSRSLIADCDELLKILTSSVKKSKNI